MTLKLVLTYHWYDFIESGEKKEEYRSIKPSIVSLLFDWKKSHDSRERFTKLLTLDFIPPNIWKYLKPYDTIEFYRGYSKDRKSMVVELKRIDIGSAVPEWSGNWQGKVFILKLGRILSKKNSE